MTIPITVSHTDAALFLQRTRKQLEQHEAANSLMLGLSLLATRDKEFAARRTYFTVENGNTWSIAATLEPNRPLVLAAAGQPSTADMASLVGHLLMAEAPVSSIVGPVSLTAMFAQEWARKTGCGYEVKFRQRIHSLGNVLITVEIPGTLRSATVEDIELVARWFAEFDAEALDEHNADAARERAIGRINSGEVFLWDDGEPRAMAIRTRPTTHTISIGAVYTPPDWRSRGYATAVVAGLSQRLLDEGFSQCVLYTDLANPVSNKIYQRIGYEPVVDSDQIVFGSELS